MFGVALGGKADIVTASSKLSSFGGDVGVAIRDPLSDEASKGSKVGGAGGFGGPLEFVSVSSGRNKDRGWMRLNLNVAVTVDWLGRGGVDVTSPAGV